ncbi:hypothetical protein GCM10009096_00610 [Parasphingorhabdus litoris]|uniref:Uncharacterized protein n=1 Tax=Parasphingorhabdus litoris TaxID=394733 RepID=A0ABP3JWR7_9SPHN|nr:DUF5992 family protein [Parasphingorhabdus litoris]
MKYLKIIAIPLFLLSTNAHAAGAYLASGATVTDVVNIANNGQNFAVKTEGGSSNCNAQWIIFPEANAPNANAHQRAYSTALTALTTGMKVTIYNYADSTCVRASYIHLMKQR